MLDLQPRLPTGLPGARIPPTAGPRPRFADGREPAHATFSQVVVRGSCRVPFPPMAAPLHCRYPFYSATALLRRPLPQGNRPITRPRQQQRPTTIEFAPGHVASDAPCHLDVGLHSHLAAKLQVGPQ